MQTPLQFSIYKFIQCNSFRFISIRCNNRLFKFNRIFHILIFINRYNAIINNLFGTLSYNHNSLIDITTLFKKI